jgi:hypothetical protein
LLKHRAHHALRADAGARVQCFAGHLLDAPACAGGEGDTDEQQQSGNSSNTCSAHVTAQRLCPV